MTRLGACFFLGHNCIKGIVCFSEDGREVLATRLKSADVVKVTDVIRASPFVSIVFVYGSADDPWIPPSRVPVLAAEYNNWGLHWFVLVSRKEFVSMLESTDCDKDGTDATRSPLFLGIAFGMR